MSIQVDHTMHGKRSSRDKQQLRAQAVADYSWAQGLERASNPLRDLQSVIDVQALGRSAAQIQSNGTVHISLVSEEYIHTGINWVRAVQNLDIKNYLVIAGDKRTSEIFSELNIQHARAALDTDGLNQSFKSPAGFSGKGLAMTALKFPVVAFLLRQGYNVTISDADAMWLQDPMPHFTAHTDIAFQRVGYFPPQIAQLWGFAACTGFAFFRCREGVAEFIDQCIKEHLQVHDDQLAMNLALFESDAHWKHQENRTPVPDQDADIKSTFSVLARDAIKGQLDRFGLELLALPHHRFWRHRWVPADISEMVICHPNSPKDDLGKLRTFETMGIRLSYDILSESESVQQPSSK